MTTRNLTPNLRSDVTTTASNNRRASILQRRRDSETLPRHPSIDHVIISTNTNRTSTTSEPKSPTQVEVSDTTQADSATLGLVDEPLETREPPIALNSSISTLPPIMTTNTHPLLSLSHAQSSSGVQHIDTERRPSGASTIGNNSATSKSRTWWWKRPELKTRLAVLLLWGLLLVAVLATYLGIALDKRIATEEFHISLILIILITAMLFCNSLVRLCLVASKPYSYPDEMSVVDREILHLPFGPGPWGYAQTSQPIPIQPVPGQFGAPLDDEGDEMKLPPPPPAYGVWRASVRVNPDQFYWVRRPNTGVQDIEEASSGHGAVTPMDQTRQSTPVDDTQSTVARPPSYASDSGTTTHSGHLLSFATEADALPLHPAEISRLEH